MVGFEQAALVRMLDEALGVWSLDTFEERMAVQKAVFILRCCGARLNYSYNWYLRGPYSPELAADLFEVVQMLPMARAQGGTLTPTESMKEVFKRFGRLLNQKPHSLPRALWLEAIASVLFLRQRGVEAVESLFCRTKPHLRRYYHLACSAIDRVLNG